MLFGKNLRWCHQRALPACVDADSPGQCGHDRLARAHIALQQAMHGHRLGKIAGDLFADPALRGCQLEGQASHQFFMQAAGMCCQCRRAQEVTLAFGLQLRQLLRQQLLGLQALPGRMAVVFQRGQRHIGRRMMQKIQRGLQRPHRMRRAYWCWGRWKRVRQVGAAKTTQHCATQVVLRQTGHSGVHRRQSPRQLATGRLEGGMHHRAAQKPALDLATRADARARSQRLLLRGIETEEAQHAGVRPVIHGHQQLAARPLGDLA